MARKAARPQGGTQGGTIVRISVALPDDTHQRLRALAQVKRTTATELVAALVAKATEGVRLPSVRGDGSAFAEDDAAA
jgi:hypothetical protein